MAHKSKEWTTLYVTWELRERLRRLGQIENRKLVAVLEEMIKDREARYAQEPTP